MRLSYWMFINVVEQHALSQIIHSWFSVPKVTAITQGKDMRVGRAERHNTHCEEKEKTGRSKDESC